MSIRGAGDPWAWHGGDWTTNSGRVVLGDRSDEDRPGSSDVFAREPGKGTRDYRRSDTRIEEDVCELLSEGLVDASEIEVSVEDQEVTLRGSVRSRKDKLLAENLAREVVGVSDVHCRLKVEKDARAELEIADHDDRPDHLELHVSGD